MTTPSSLSITLVDAHVHFQDCFSVADFFNNAARNFQSAASRAAAGAEFEGVLILTESRGVDWYGELAAGDGGTRAAAVAAGWQIHNTREPEAIGLYGRDGRKLILISGRQVITAERLEVLWLGTLAKPEDGTPVREVIANARAVNAVPVIPWGFGKWMGDRGRCLRRILNDDADPDRPAVHLGDNGGRPFFWPIPGPLKNRGQRRNVPGSDPLPFTDEIIRPGSFGFWFQGKLDPLAPANHLKRLIDDHRVTLNPYGRPERVIRFVRHQIAMQMRLRAGGRGNKAA